MAVVMRAAATDVKEVVIAGSGHWLYGGVTGRHGCCRARLSRQATLKPSSATAEPTS
jgi:hypothetical protein